MREPRTGWNAEKKGEALEKVGAYIFKKIPGVLHVIPNSVDQFGSAEIDLVIWNDQSRRGLEFLPRTFLVECKNQRASKVA